MALKEMAVELKENEDIQHKYEKLKEEHKKVNFNKCHFLSEVKIQ